MRKTFNDIWKRITSFNIIIPTVVTKQSKMTAEKPYQLGLDISGIQHTIDWSKIHEPIAPFVGGAIRPVTYISIKVSEGAMPAYPNGVVDGMCHSHATNAQNTFMPIGYYHFARYHKKSGDAQEQALKFATTLQSLPKPTIHNIKDQITGKATKDYYLDAETNDEVLTPEEWEQWNKDFINKVIELVPDAKDNIGIYGYASLFNANLKPNHSLGSYDLWLAGYGKENQLILPHGWNNGWAGWQFTGSGNHPAISGNVDMDFIK